MFTRYKFRPVLFCTQCTLNSYSYISPCYTEASHLLFFCQCVNITWILIDHGCLCCIFVPDYNWLADRPLQNQVGLWLWRQNLKFYYYYNSRHGDAVGSTGTSQLPLSSLAYVRVTSQWVPIIHCSLQSWLSQTIIPMYHTHGHIHNFQITDHTYRLQSITVPQ